MEHRLGSGFQKGTGGIRNYHKPDLNTFKFELEVLDSLMGCDLGNQIQINERERDETNVTNDPRPSRDVCSLVE
jgi:hypothetical protein